MTQAERNEPETLLEVEEVAALLKVHPQTVYDMARSGELRGFKVGRWWRFLPSDLKAWASAKAEAAVRAVEKAS
jgi:excisionase family DNA binding protein